MCKQTVLILSDKPEAGAVWMDAFRQRGMDVTVAESLDAAASVWTTAGLLLTIVDLSLPAARSLECCRHLRQVGPCPILLLLDSPRSEQIMEAYQIGVDECLLQPIHPAVVLLKALAWSMRNGWPTVHDVSTAASMTA